MALLPGRPAAFALLALTVATLESCSPSGITRSFEPVGIALDSRAEHGQVELHWLVTVTPDCWTWGCPEPDSPVGRIEVQMSTAGPKSGFRTIVRRASDGTDSATVEGLTDGRMYWFRILGQTEAGRTLAESAPLMTSPGHPSALIRSIPIEVSGRFGWSPDGDSIVFVRTLPGSRSELTTMHITSGATRILAVYPWGEWAGDAVWSPDGSTIAYTHTPTLTSGQLDYRVWLADLETGACVPASPGRIDFDPAWGGGDWLYFCRGTPGPPNIPEVWRIRPGHPESAEPVTGDPRARKYNPTVRPGDELVVYEGATVGAKSLHSALHAVDPLVHAPAALTHGSWYSDRLPSWDPDGRHITFVSNRSGHDEIWSLDHATGELRQLTRGDDDDVAVLAQPSPDGRTLAVLRGHQGGWSGRGVLEFLDVSAH